MYKYHIQITQNNSKRWNYTTMKMTTIINSLTFISDKVVHAFTYPKPNYTIFILYNALIFIFKKKQPSKL